MTTITVLGSSCQSADADRARVHGHLTVRGTTRAEAQQSAALAQQCAREEVSSASVSFANLAIRPLREQDEDGNWHLVGYAASVRVEVTVAELGQLSAVLEQLAQSQVDITWVSWELDDRRELERSARAEAIADARRRAQDYADGAQMQLGELTELREPQATDPTSRPRAAGAPGGGAPQLELTPQPITVAAAIEATFRLA